MITREEVEMLAVLLQRAGTNWYEAAWANMVMNKLRELAARQERLTTEKPPEDSQVTKS